MSESIKNFIMIFKRCFSLGDDLLSAQQLFLYAFLFRNRQQYADGWITEISVNAIFHRIKCKIDGANTKKRNSIIIELLSLRDRGFLMFEESTKGKLGKDEVLSISFSTSDDNTSFIKIPYTVFDKFDDREKFWLYTYFNFNKFMNRGVKVSHRELCSMLDVSKSLLISKIESMNREESDPRIYKFSGSYINGSKQQEENEYFVELTSDQLDKYNRLYDENGKARYKKSRTHMRSSDEVIDTDSWGDATVAEIREFIKYSNWGKKEYGVFVDLTYDDYELYRVSVDGNIDLAFNSRCKRAIDTFNSVVPDKYDFAHWEDVYQGKCPLRQEYIPAYRHGLISQEESFDPFY